MKYCPNCGHELKPGDKFCQNCGYDLSKSKNSEEGNNLHADSARRKVSNAKSKLNDAVKNFDSSWFKESRHRWYTVGGILVALFLIFIAGRVTTNGSVTAPKDVSFAKPGLGTRVWLRTENGKGKDAIVDYIDVTKNGKFIQYQIFDDNITLAKVSKMSNSELIKLGKEQDKKYFDESINEVKALRDGKGQIGLQNDLMGDDDLKKDLKMGSLLYFSDMRKVEDTGATVKNTRMISKQEFDKLKDELPSIPPYDGKFHEEVYEHTEKSIIELSGLDPSKYTTRRCDALIENMKKVKYLAPEWQKLSITNATDDSGNKIISQTVKYKSIDEFNDSGIIDKNVQKLSNTQKQAVANALNEYSILGTEEVKPNEVKAKMGDAFNKAFDKDYYLVTTKNMFKPHTFMNNMTLSSTTSQQIYNTRYIGYQVGDDNYLLTKAQNDTQKAVFEDASK